MAKKVEIDIEVNSKSVTEAKENVDGLNQSIQNTEKTTQDFGKNIKIEYDKAGNATDVLVDKSLSLTKQQRAIKAQMEILTATGKAQTKEFTILQRKYNDIGDSLAQNKARSQELFGTLSLLPGPVGEFSSKLQGGLDLLKTFSGVKLTDIKNQFKAVGDDLKEIFKGFSEFNKKPIQTPTTPGQTTTGGGGTTPTVAGTGNVAEQIDKRNAALREYVKENGRANLSNMNFDATTGKMVSRLENISKASTGAATSIRGQKIATDALTTSEIAATTATTLLEAALTALGIGIIIAGIAAILSMLKDIVVYYTGWGKATEIATKQIENFNEAIKRQNELLQGSIAQVDFETKKAELIAKIAKKSEDDIFNITKQGLIDRKNLITRDLNQALATQKKLAGEDVEKLSEEQARRRFEQLQANADNIKKLTEDESRAKEAIELASLTRRLSIEQDYYSRRLAEIDAAIQLEIDKDVTSGEKLAKLQEERQKMVIAHDKLGANQRKLLKDQDRKKNEDALKEDQQRLEAFMAKEDDIRIAAIKDNQTREEQARSKKLNSDILALQYDKEYQKLIKENKSEADNILINMETAYQEDLLKIRETYFLKKFQKMDEEKTLEIEKKAQRTQNLLAEDEKYLIEGQLGLFGKALINTKQFLENRFTDMRRASQLEHDNTQYQLEQELLTLQKGHEDKNLTDDEYANKKKEINQRISDNDQKLIEKQISLDRTLLEAKKETASMTMNIAENLVGVLSALGEFSTDWQITAAIAEAGLGIAKIIISTQVAIAEYAALVAGLPGGALMATAYAIKAKINAALGIAAITVGAIGRINQVKGQGKSAEPEKGNKPNYGDGGMINGPLHAQGGVAINAEGGEAVMTRGAVTSFRPLLSMMNQMGGGTSFSRGAVGQANFDNPKTNNTPMEQPIIKTYVVSNELTTDAHRAARLKNLSTL